MILAPGTEPEWISGSSKAELAAYEKPDGNGQRLFCPTCGSHVGHVDPGTGQWAVVWGILDEKFWQLGFHSYSRSATGGGMVDWLPKIAGREVLHLSPDDQDFPGQCPPNHGPDGEERLRAECCCGGVSLVISRPGEEIINDKHMGKYVSPTDKKKWKAFLDLCRDCGPLCGTSVVPWLLIPRIAIEPGGPSDLGKLGTIKTYKSSEPNTRGFRGVCGATVFGTNRHRTPDGETGGP